MQPAQQRGVPDITGRIIVVPRETPLEVKHKGWFQKLPIVESIGVKWLASKRRKLEPLFTEAVDFVKAQADVSSLELSDKITALSNSQKKLLWEKILTSSNKSYFEFINFMLEKNPELIFELREKDGKITAISDLYDPQNLSETTALVLDASSQYERTKQVFGYIFPDYDPHLKGDTMLLHARGQTLNNLHGKMNDIKRFGASSRYLSPVRELCNYIDGKAGEKMPEKLRARLEKLNEEEKKVVMGKIRFKEMEIFTPFAKRLLELNSQMELAAGEDGRWEFKNSTFSLANLPETKKLTTEFISPLSRVESINYILSGAHGERKFLFTVQILIGAIEKKYIDFIKEQRLLSPEDISTLSAGTAREAPQSG